MRIPFSNRCHAFALALVAVAGSATAAAAQAGNAPGTVVIAILDDYPLFQRSEGAGRAGSDLRAMLIRRDFVDESRSVILLNPAHLTPEVLYGALKVLESSFGAQSQARLIGLTRRSTPAPDALPQGARNAMRAMLAELLTAPLVKVRGHAHGRHLVRSTAALGLATQ